MRVSQQFLLNAPLALLLLCSPRSALAEDESLKKVSFPGGFCDLYLLAQEAVQIELDMPPVQVAKIQDAVADLIEMQGKVGFDDHFRLLRRHQKLVLATLKAEQLKRLQQISLQYGATGSFSDAPVRRDLKITEEQFAKISALQYQLKENVTMTEELAAIRKEFFDYPKRADNAWQMREWQILAVLTPDQRKQWKEMIGEPFKGPVPSPVLIPKKARMPREK